MDGSIETLWSYIEHLSYFLAQRHLLELFFNNIRRSHDGVVII